MKELFRDRDIIRVGYYQSILESEGIATYIRNEHLTGAGVAEIPIPDFFPALGVINDDDYEEALETLRERVKENEQEPKTEITCSKCSEINPGNFEVCWSCNENITTNTNS